MADAVTGATEAVADAVEEVVDALTGVVSAVVGLVTNAVVAVIGLLGESVPWLSGVTTWLAGVVLRVGSVLSAAFELAAVAATVAAALVRIFAGILVLNLDQVLDGLRQLAQDLVGLFLMSLAEVTGLVQVILGLERAGRPLTEAEIRLLTPVFLDGLVYKLVRIVSGSAGIFSSNDGPFAVRNRIYTKTEGELQDHTLVHEMYHVNSHQTTGSSYAGDAVIAQLFAADAYDWKLDVAAGTAIGDVNEEACASTVEAAWAKGGRKSTKDPYLVTLEKGSFFNQKTVSDEPHLIDEAHTRFATAVVKRMHFHLFPKHSS